jgi:hypothetical protein
MKYSKKCECCGHVVTAYTLPLNEGMVRAFILFARKYIQAVTDKSRKDHMLKKGEIGLTNTQYSNFQNLRHYGLIWQRERGGAWMLTKLGSEFYFGTATILTPAAHMGGNTLPPDHPAWNTHPQPRRTISIRDVLPEEYKQRPEFQAEKSGQLTFA